LGRSELGWTGAEKSMMRKTLFQSARVCLVLGLAALTGCTPFREYFRNGCKVGPNYCRPATPVAENWINANDRRVQTDHNNLHNWWSVFHDPTLNALIQNASQQNLTVRQAGFRVLQARAARAIVAGNLFPQQQDISGDYQRHAISVATANTPAVGVNRFYDQWDVSGNLAWELDFWGRFRRAVEAADADLNASIENYDEVLITFLADVASTYIEIRTIEERIVLTQQNVKLQQETLNVVDARFRGGQVSEFDYDQAASTLAQTQALIPQFQQQLRVATDRLCVLLGMPPKDLELILGHGPIPTAPPDVAIGIPADLLRQRPDVRSAERQVAAQSARVGVATSELYPHIAITGTVGFSAEQFSDLFTNEAFMGSVGPSFQWNVLNYGRLLNNIRLQDARLAELIVAYQQSVLQANSEVEDGVARFLYSQERARDLAVSVDAANKAYIIGASQYRGGTIDFTRLVLVEQNLVQQQDQYAAAQGEIALGLVDTYRALGGGWEIRLERLPVVESIPQPPSVPTPPQQPPMESMPVPSEMGQPSPPATELAPKL
jgi:NodT family efflux transporter outer membrane factor (OMF) lipoprotein